MLNSRMKIVARRIQPAKMPGRISGMKIWQKVAMEPAQHAIRTPIQLSKDLRDKFPVKNSYYNL